MAAKRVIKHLAPVSVGTIYNALSRLRAEQRKIVDSGIYAEHVVEGAKKLIVHIDNTNDEMMEDH